MTCLNLRACALAALFLSGAAAQAGMITRIDEGFDAVGSLAASGWILSNQSTPAGSVATWYQGNTPTYAAQAGAAESYAASNYNAAADGGTVRNWLITPVFSTALAGVVSFWARGGGDPAYQDDLRVGLVNAAGDLDSLSLLGFVAGQDAWTQYTFDFGAMGDGSQARLALIHADDQSTANYIGVDSLNVSSIPEPSSVLLAATSLLALVWAGRRQRGR